MENTDEEHLTTKSMQLSSLMMHCVQLKIVTIKEDPTSTTGTMGRQSWGRSTMGNHETQQDCGNCGNKLQLKSRQSLRVRCLGLAFIDDLFENILADHQGSGQVKASLVRSSLEIHLDPSLPVQVACPLSTGQRELGGRW